MNIAMKTGDSLVSFSAFNFFSVCMRETWRVNRENERRKGEGEERRGGEEKRGEERRRKGSCVLCVCV